MINPVHKDRFNCSNCDYYEFITKDMRGNNQYLTKTINKYYQCTKEKRKKTTRLCNFHSHYELMKQVGERRRLNNDSNRII
jgi:ribosomal protein S27AE